MKSISYYNNIDDLPLKNWIQCTSGQIRFVRKDLKHGNNFLDELHFEMIFDSYIKEFGLSEMYIKLLKTMHKKTLLELDFVLTRNRFKLTEVEMQIARLENLVNNNKNGMTIEQTLIHLSKWMNQWIDAKKITTREYFDMMKEFEKSLKTAK
jgi:hypothetical protein